MAIVDQLLFGYSGGHQLLGGSRPLDPRDLRLLLGATDMSMEGSTERFLTGLALSTEDSYALCATWAAPEASRPGAVWARVLIISADLLGVLEDPLGLAMFLSRPESTDVRPYSSGVHLNPGQPATEMPPEDLLDRVVAAAYGAGSRSVIVEPDLQAAEGAIGAIWRAQWPELRFAFTFRTRPTARADKAAADVVIAKRVRGTTRPSSKATRSPWVKLIAQAVTVPEQSTFASFVSEFGPLEQPTIRSVRVLADVFRRLEEGSVDTVRGTLESSYPSPHAGVALKVALFGLGSDRPWSGSEAERTKSLLASEVDAWDVEALNLSTRIQALISTQGMDAVSETLSGTSPGVNRAVVDALTERGRSSDISNIGARHPEIAIRVATERPDLLNNRDAWDGLPSTTATALLKVGAFEERSVVAAIRSGHGSAVLKVAGTRTVAAAIAHYGTYADAVELPGIVDAVELRGHPTDDRVALLLVALHGRAQVDPELPDRLERCRNGADELWLRAAVEAIASPDLPHSNVLTVTFGPLHDAITADRLPRECWNRLDRVLPPASDPALRLRRYLVAVAQQEHWNPEQFERALRGAGPHAGQLLHDFSDDDDWWVAATRAVIRAAVGLFGGHR